MAIIKAIPTPLITILLVDLFILTGPPLVAYLLPEDSVLKSKSSLFFLLFQASKSGLTFCKVKTTTTVIIASNIPIMALRTAHV